MKALKSPLFFLLLLFSFSSVAQVTKQEFEIVKTAIYQAYEELRPSENEKLFINPVVEGVNMSWWDITPPNASYVRYDQKDIIEHRIYLFGGFARFKGMTPDGIALTACHEIGHGIAGAPFKDTSDYSNVPTTTEGQADYFATKICLPVVFRYLKALRPLSESETYSKLCKQQTKHDTNTCLRLMASLESDIALLKYLGHTASFDTFSINIQEEINTSVRYYPDSQCRLDTMINGILDLGQPECWFPGGEANGKFRD